jgi:hypothetical protein
MKPARRNRRLTAWIAIFAILMAALAPGVARALASPQQAMPWSEICTMAGIQQGPRDAAPTGESGQPRHPDGMGFKHCPFCLNHAGHFALPATAVDGLPVVGTDARLFPPSVAQHTSRLVRTAAQPRAPPAVY